jgi:hypothetical protein
MPPANGAKRATNGYSPDAGKGFKESAARYAAQRKRDARPTEPRPD